MTTDDQTHDTTPTAPIDDRDRGWVGSPAPRGNPATEPEWVRRGEEQLEKIAGN